MFYKNVKTIQLFILFHLDSLDMAGHLDHYHLVTD